MASSSTYSLFGVMVISIAFLSCNRQEGCTDPLAENFNIDATIDDGSCRYIFGCTDIHAKNYNPKATKDDGSCVYGNDAVPAPLAVPPHFYRYLLPPLIPEDNPQTNEGVSLGRKLFFDPVLSGDKSISCADCHMPYFAFSDTARFSTGIDNLEGLRNSMPIFNAAWNFKEKFFWDGRAGSLEAQALEPVSNPLEMNNTWPAAVTSVQADTAYRDMFQAAFGTSIIDSILIVKAIAQFERTIISAGSKFDRFLMGKAELSPQEERGFNIFMDENGGDCFHCHGGASNPRWTDNAFHNNGLDSIITDLGLGAVTGNPTDYGKFKTPSLRNLSFSAPYMHDGRFATLDEVIDHYSEELKNSPTIDPLMKSIRQGGVRLTLQEKEDLKAFLRTLDDYDFINGSYFIGLR
jgi:cytochrome c peroxidase